MTTHRLPFEQVEQAFRLMQTKADGCIKPLVIY
jgi:threonine dehydrogenase-like Zn-dependent dehydrogenase